MNTSSLSFKMVLIMAFAMSLAIAASLAALTRVYGSVNELERISREDFDARQAILYTEVAYRNQVNDWKNVLVRGVDAAAAEKQWKLYLVREQDVTERARKARAISPDKAIQELLDSFIQKHAAANERFHKSYQGFVAAGFDVREGNRLASGANANPDAPLLEAEKKAEERGNASLKAATESASMAYRTAIAATITAMLATLVGLWFFLRKSVLQPIGVAVRAAERIATGDLTMQVKSGSDDEAGQLLAALDTMSRSLTEVVTQVRDSAESVLSASSQVAAGTTDLSQRTEEQASSLEETAASMEELSSTVKQNADNAREADDVARNASKRAQQGGEEVNRVVATMTEISDSARRIADIISVIDAIAFQTNILALNAAVEAARAGEQGRGFAVVAAEVRTLAQRSAQAAKEIKELIGQSVQRAQVGTQLVDQAGNTIQALVVDVKRVSELMESIAEASIEQSRGVQQVNKTVTEMDKVVQQNASAVQQSAAAAEGMRQQAQMMVESVSSFRLARAAQPRTASDSEAPAPAVANGGRGKLENRPKAAAQRAPEALALAGGGDDWEEF